jgi:hypothetical protein
MPEPVHPDDLLQVRCGRCGVAMTMTLRALRDRWTVDCDACTRHPSGVHHSLAATGRPPASRRES